MNRKELSDRLYEKMVAEQDAFREELLKLPPEQILDKAYEYVMREDILMVMEDPELLSAERCKALLKSRTPVAEVYEQYNKMDCSYMEDIRTAFETRADAMIRHQKQRDQSR